MLINRALIPSVILTATLVAGGCNNKSKSQTQDMIAPAVQTLKGQSASHKDFDKLLSVKRRKVKPADANIALSKMGLDETGDGPFKWADKTSKDGNFTYSNLTTTGKDGENIKIDQLKLTGAHMKGNNPSFDRIDIDGLHVIDKDADITFAHVSMARPTPALGASIMRAVETIRKSGDWGRNSGLEDKDIGFGALLVDTVKLVSDDANVNIKSLGWGENEDTNEALFLLDDIKVVTTDQPGKPSANFSLGTLSATGIDMDAVRKLREKSGGNDIKLSPANFNFFNPIVKGFSLKDFGLSVDTLTFDMPSVDSASKTKGDVTTTTQVMAPATLTFAGQPKSRELKELWQGLKDSGYETLEVSGSSVTTLNKAKDSFSVDDGYFSLKDGFDLRFDYSGQGLSALGEDISEENMEAALEKMALNRMNISLKDKSIVERAIAFAALKQNMPEMLVRMQAKGGIMFGGAYAAQQATTPEQQAAITDMTNALGAFVDQGGTLSIGLNPDTPLAAADLMVDNPLELDPARLGLTIKHE